MSSDDNSNHTDRNVPTDPKGNLLKDLWDKSDAMGVAILEMLEEWAVRTNSPFVALWTHGVAPAHGKIYFDTIQAVSFYMGKMKDAAEYTFADPAPPTPKRLEVYKNSTSSDRSDPAGQRHAEGPHVEVHARVSLLPLLTLQCPPTGRPGTGDVNSRAPSTDLASTTFIHRPPLRKGTRTCLTHIPGAGGEVRAR